MRLILDPGVTHDDIDDALAAQGCRLVNVVPASEANPTQLVWATADRQGLLYVVEDHRLGVTYLTGSLEAAHLKGQLEALGEGLAHLSAEAIVEILSAALQEPIDEEMATRALGWLVLSVWAVPSTEQLELLRRALSSDRAQIRGAALWATSYALWDGLRFEIEQICAADNDPMLRQQALQVLELYLGRINEP